MLSDAKKKGVYDQYGEEGLAAQAQGGGAGGFQYRRPEDLFAEVTATLESETQAQQHALRHAWQAHTRPVWCQSLEPGPGLRLPAAFCLMDRHSNTAITAEAQRSDQRAGLRLLGVQMFGGGGGMGGMPPGAGLHNLFGGGMGGGEQPSAVCSGAQQACWVL